MQDLQKRIFDENHKKECKKYNIEPLVTINHHDVPMDLALKQDGWLCRDTIDAYVRMCKILFTEYNGLVKYWLTFNEINSSF